MKKIYIFRVYHIRIIAKQIGSHDMKQTDSSITIVRNVCMLTSASMIVYLFFTRSWSAIIGPKPFFTRLWSAIIGTKQPISTIMARTINMHMDLQISSCWEHISTWNMHEHLVKVPPYSKLNFQGKVSSPKTGVILL